MAQVSPLGIILLAILAVSDGFARPNARRGGQVFEQCKVCHTTDGEPKKTGPSLRGVFRKRRLLNGNKPTRANVLAVINAGSGRMPAYETSLNDQQKADLIAYLKTL